MTVAIESATEAVACTASANGGKGTPLQINVIHELDLFSVEGGTAVDHGGKAHEVFCIVDLIDTLCIGFQ